jgi:two-component system NtrC family sensor kinase
MACRVLKKAEMGGEAAVAGECILIIDDSAEIRSFLRDTILGPNGYKVLIAHDGQEGLKRALADRPDLILLDVNMPRMTGLEVLEKLREAKYEWPVILMTFHGSESVAVQAFRLGVRDYIRKPFEIEEVLAGVDRALVESKLRKEREELLRRLEASNQQLNLRLAELTTLYAIGQAVTSLLDLEKLLNRIVEAAVYLCRADEGVLYLIDEKSDELYMAAAQGIGERTAHSFRLRVSDSLVGEVVRTGKPAIRNSSVGDARFKVKTGYLVHSLANVPLNVKDKRIGVLSVANRVRIRNFSLNDIRQLGALANYAAIAIENARLYEATRKVVAAEVLNNTVVTVSHYVNNPLMTLMVNADRLRLAENEGRVTDADGLVADTVRFTEMKVEEISAVISILHDLASPQFVTYIDDIKMLDIEAKVRERLKNIKEKYQV